MRRDDPQAQGQPACRFGLTLATDQVQDYFASLGFAFDAEVNPADVLMDILAGRGTHQVNRGPSSNAPPG